MSFWQRKVGKKVQLVNNLLSKLLTGRSKIFSSCLYKSIEVYFI